MVSKTTSFAFALLLCCGCSNFQKNLFAEKEAKHNVNLPQVPPAAVAPAEPPAVVVVKKVEAKPAPKPKAPAMVKPVPQPVAPAVVVKPEPPPQPRPQLAARKPKSPRSPDKYRRGAGLWKAFSRLSSAEQQNMMKLQREDPEKFRHIMQEKADQLYAKERARQHELESLAAQYHTAKTNSEKAKIKIQLRKMLQEDFNQRLIDSRRDLEANRRRLKKMEVELQKREKNSSAIVDAILAERLSGKTMKPRQMIRK